MRDHLALRKLKVWCLLLLAAVFAHALLPVEARASGSAFNPSTAEVSTSHAHRTVAVRQAVPQRDPLGGKLPLAVVVRTGTAALTPGLRAGRPLPVSVPLRPGWRCALSQPRAPPFA